MFYIHSDTLTVNCGRSKLTRYGSIGRLHHTERWYISMLSMAAASAATTITIPSRRDRRVEDHRLALRHELVYGAEREVGFYLNTR